MDLQGYPYFTVFTVLKLFISIKFLHISLLQFLFVIYFRHIDLCLPSSSGVPAVVDFAAMRDAVKRLGGDPEKINPCCPADLVIDHSVQVDIARR